MLMARPIRILELRSVRGTGGGPEKTILLGAALADSRFEVTVCYLRDRRDDAFGVTERAKNTAIDYIEILERHSFDPGVWFELRRLIRRRQIDVVHAHDYKTNLLAWLLARAGRVATLSTVHGWTGHSKRERLGYYPADKLVLSRFPRLIAVSSDIRNELVRHGANPSRITTVLNGIDHRHCRRDRSKEPEVRASLGFTRGDVVIGAVGRLEPQKRFDLLLDAFASLNARRPETRLVIVGDGSQRAALEEKRKALHLEGACTLLGHVIDVARVHHAFDLFVQSSDYEGTPNAVLEAMAFETPLVATDVGGTRELVADGVHGRIVPPGDIDRLNDAIESLLTDRRQARAMADNARLRVENELSFESRVRRVEAIYEEIAPRA
jgi:glycosyltransferase involved in cell wall biosynthesis